VVTESDYHVLLSERELSMVVDALYVFKQTRLGYTKPLPDTVEVLRRRLLMLQVEQAKGDQPADGGWVVPPEST
jgi:hypothetical protein